MQGPRSLGHGHELVKTDTTKGARTLEEIETLSGQSSKKNFGCLRKPIFSIPTDHIIIDTLHLFLRIGDLLINMLITELRRQDGIDKKRSFKLNKLPSYVGDLFE